MPNSPLFKRFIKEKKGDIIHSSAYASAQNKGIGTASSETFSERMAVEKNRQSIESYQYSKVVKDSKGAPKAATYDAASDTFAHSSDISTSRYAIDNQPVSYVKETVKQEISPVSKPVSPREQMANRFAPRQSSRSNPPARRNPGISR